MTNRRRGQTVRTRGLTWSPPALTTPTTLNITVPGTYNLTAGQDYIVNLPTGSAISAGSLTSSAQSIVTLIGGRNISMIGGRITAPAIVSATLTATYTDGDATIHADTAAGFPAAGMLNMSGYGFNYTGISGNNFTGVSRRSFVYSNAKTLPLSAGETIWVGEAHRSALTLQDFSGTAHVEGIQLDGDLCDGIRCDNDLTPTVFQVQNVRVGVCQQHDTANQWDGHPDAIQLISGPITFRIDRATLLSEGRAVLNKNDSVQDCLNITARDVVGIGSQRSVGDIVWDSVTVATVWDIQNCWARQERSTSPATANLATFIGAADTYLDFVPSGAVGLNYVSPGYL